MKDAERIDRLLSPTPQKNTHPPTLKHNGKQTPTNPNHAPQQQQQQASKNPRTVRLTIHFLAFYAGKRGPEPLVAVLEQIQPGMTQMLLQQVGGGSGCVCVWFSRRPISYIIYI